MTFEQWANTHIGAFLVGGNYTYGTCIKWQPHPTKPSYALFTLQHSSGTCTLALKFYKKYTHMQVAQYVQTLDFI